MAQLGFQRLVVQTGVFAGHRQNFRREQVQDDAVFVRGPGGAVFAQERSPRAFFAAKTNASIQQTGHKPFEADGHFAQATPDLDGYFINDRTGYQRFSDSRVARPIRTVLEDVPNGDCQIVVGVHQAHAGRDNAVAVKIHIVPKGNIEFILHVDQVRHGVRAGAIHADLTVPVQGHEGEGGVHTLVNHFNIEVVSLRDRLPISNA